MEIVNTGQASAWNGYEDEHWAAHHDGYDAVTSGFDDTLRSAAGIRAADRVLDIGCGTGSSPGSPPVAPPTGRRSAWTFQCPCSNERVRWQWKRV